jgi:hypothetical protein
VYLKRSERTGSQLPRSIRDSEEMEGHLSRGAEPIESMLQISILREDVGTIPIQAGIGVKGAEGLSDRIQET